MDSLEYSLIEQELPLPLSPLSPLEDSTVGDTVGLSRSRDMDENDLLLWSPGDCKEDPMWADSGYRTTFYENVVGAAADIKDDRDETEADAINNFREATEASVNTQGFLIKLDDMVTPTHQPILKNDVAFFVSPNDRSDPQVPKTPIAIHPKSLPLHDDLNLRDVLVVDRDNSKHCYWRGENRLYIKPGEEFTLKYDYNSTTSDAEMYLDIFPVYEDEEYAHHPVFRCDQPAPNEVVEVVEGGEGIQDLGGRHGVRVLASGRQTRLRVHMWDNRNDGKRRREHLSVQLYFILYDAQGRCRGLNSMQVRVTAQPRRKRRDDKKKMERENLQAEKAARRSSRSKRVSRRRPHRESSLDGDGSDDEPLQRKVLKLEFECPVTAEGRQFLESAQLFQKQCLQRNPSSAAPFQRNIEMIENTLLEHFRTF